MRNEGRAATLRLAIGAAIGAWVCSLLLATGISAQQGTCPTTTPGYPNCPAQTAQSAQQQAATPTSTNTAVPGAAATAAPPNSAVIAGGRGRVANVRGSSFTVLWTSDAETTGQVLYGAAASLGSTAGDIRGGVSGQTHYVDVTGLQPGTTYFFDVQSGGAVDNNLGQHYQIRTGPELGAAPSNNAVVGSVLNPGGGSPAGAALVWATVRDGNGQPTNGASQLLATLAGSDGRFRLGLQPRVPDLSAYFIYQNQGDLIDLFGKAATGEVSGTVGTEITADGGTSPAEARMVLMQVAATTTPAPTTAGAPSPTATLPPTATAALPAAPTPPAAAPTPVPPPTATPVPPAAAPPPPAPVATTGPAVQLPPLKEMLLARFGLAPSEQYPPPGAPTPPAAVPATAVPPAAAPPRPVAPTVGPAGGAPLPPPAGGAVNPAPTPLGQPAAGSAGPAGVLPPAATAGGPLVAPRPEAPNLVATPLGQAPVATVAPVPTGVGLSPAPTGLASMPPAVTILFYGGMLLVLGGCGIAVYSLLSGPDWRPR